MIVPVLQHEKLGRINLKEVIGMNMKLLRAKMALKGDFELTPLTKLLDLSRPAVTARMNGSTEWKLPEIRKVIQHYSLTEEETVEIFGLRGANEY